MSLLSAGFPFGQLISHLRSLHLCPQSCRLAEPAVRMREHLHPALKLGKLGITGGSREQKIRPIRSGEQAAGPVVTICFLVLRGYL